MIFWSKCMDLFVFCSSLDLSLPLLSSQLILLPPTYTHIFGNPFALSWHDTRWNTHTHTHTWWLYKSIAHTRVCVCVDNCHFLSSTCAHANNRLLNAQTRIKVIHRSFQLLPIDLQSRSKANFEWTSIRQKMSLLLRTTNGHCLLTGWLAGWLAGWVSNSVMIMSSNYSWLINLCCLQNQTLHPLFEWHVFKEKGRSPNRHLFIDQRPFGHPSQLIGHAMVKNWSYGGQSILLFVYSID